ncbi:MAG: DUF177 domain-containing protein [Bacillota bacterium]|nr:DUF177 domain-containing protein [Bacillota bacterium]
MIINLSGIIDSEGKLPIKGMVEFGRVEFDNMTYEFTPCMVEGEIVNVGGNLELTANVKGQYETACTRCLAPVIVDVDTDIFEVLNGKDVTSELFKINRNECEIDELFLSAILTEIPLIALCSEDCKGLCPTCGKNLNEGPCSCGE